MDLAVVTLEGKDFSKFLRSTPDELASELHSKFREVVKIVGF